MAIRQGDSLEILAPYRETLIRYFSLIAGTMVLGLLVSAPARGESLQVVASYVGLLLVFGAAFALRSTRRFLAGALCSLGPFVLVTILVRARGGIVHPAGVVAYMTLIATSGLCWSSRGALTISALSSGVFAWLLVETGVDLPFNRLQVWAELSVQVLIMFMLVHFSLRAVTRSAQETLSHQARFREAVESSPDAIIAVDSDDLIQVYNERAAAMTGVSAEEARGTPFAELSWLSPDSQKRLLSALSGLEHAVAVSPIELSHGDGSRLEASVSLVTRHAHQPDRLICIRDVTERHRQQESRKALDARLAESKSLEALGRLAGGVAHDFNNMLTVILGTAEMQEGRARTKQDAQDAQRIQEAGKHAADLTRQLLAFGREQVMSPRVVCPNAMLEGLQPLLLRLVPESIRLVLRGAGDLGYIRVDETHLKQVIVNLVTNGTDAMPRGGTLTVETESVSIDEHPTLSAGQYVRIAVTDTGEGMDAETRARIFEPFFTTKANGAGTGLGLATVHGVVAQSGGSIIVESEPGNGANFQIYFPRVEAPAPDRRAVSGPQKLGEGAARILLVEDQPAVRESVKSMLSSLGHHVEEAQDGQDALQRFESKISSFDLLLSDVVMPRLSGPELAARLFSKHSGLQVLFMSGYAGNQVTNSQLPSDKTGFIAKPLDLESLRRKLDEMLAHSARARRAS